MQNGKKSFLICYDISSDKKRTKLSSYLESEVGCTRVNKSVFIGKIAPGEMQKFFEILEKIISKKDSILVFRLCKSCLKEVIEIKWGKGPLQREKTTCFV